MSAEPSTLPAASRGLSFAFAKRHGVVVRGMRDGAALCALRHDASPTAVAEARRVLRAPLLLERVSDEDFDRLLRVTYEGGASLQMVGGR